MHRRARSIQEVLNLVGPSPVPRQIDGVGRDGGDHRPYSRHPPRHQTTPQNPIVLQQRSRCPARRGSGRGGLDRRQTTGVPGDSQILAPLTPGVVQQIGILSEKIRNRCVLPEPLCQERAGSRMAKSPSREPRSRHPHPVCAECRYRAGFFSMSGTFRICSVR